MSNLTPAGASKHLKAEHGITRSPRTLANLRSTGGGPAYHRTPAGEILYPVESLDAWAEKLLGPAVENTAQERAKGRVLPTMREAREAKEAQA